jgi:hypothetical protein
MFYRQFRELIVGLNLAGVRYLVVGGLAVIAHGYTRLTQDIDMILDLEDQGGLLTAITAIEAMGYRPRAPVPLSQFADPRKRAEWINAKDMLVFSLYRADAGTELDLFISLPFNFDEAWGERLESEIDGGVVASFVDLRRLMDMKRKAGRPKDLEDIRVLRELSDAPPGT